MPENQYQTNISNDILIVDDETSNLKLLTELLATEGYEVRPANKPRLAIDSALTSPPKLILLDVLMPEMDGYEVCRLLKQNERTRDIPILFVSALQDLEDRVRAFEAGGVDFISKPFQKQEILARVHTHIDLRNFQLNLEALVSKGTADLMESESRFRATFEQAAVGIANVSLNGNFLRLNKKFCEIVGYANHEMLSLRFQDITHPDDFKTDLEYLAQVVNGERDNFSVDKRYYRKDGSLVWVNLTVSLMFDEARKPKYFVSVVKDITERKQAEKNLNIAYREIEELQKKLKAESNYLQEEIKLEHNFENIIGQSEALKYVLHRVEQVAPQESSVLILGETGTGKELIARALHKLSKRGKRPLVKVNCAALPSELIESELFGREKGAFTGATTTQIGRFELAKGTTIFLDEIGEMPLELQSKLLRVIESGEFERLGSPRTLHSDARILAATNRNLEEEVRKNRFREDLLYRLQIFPITVPPLQDRTEDIPLLVNSFVKFFSRKMGKPSVVEVSMRSMQELQSYPWPGNIRELKHVIESAMITTTGKKLEIQLPKIGKLARENLMSFEEMERNYLLKVLKAKNWKLGGVDSASSILGMPPSTLRSRMNKLGLKRP